MGNGHLKILFLVCLSLNLDLCQALKSCNDTVTQLTICKLYPNYDKGRTNGKPLIIDTFSITLYSVDEVNEDSATLTMSLLLKLEWNDTRLTLKDPQG